MYCRLHIALYLFTHNFTNITVFVCGVHRLGNIFICPNVNGTFSSLHQVNAGLNELLSSFYNAKCNQHTCSTDMRVVWPVRPSIHPSTLVYLTLSLTPGYLSRMLSSSAIGTARNSQATQGMYSLQWIPGLPWGLYPHGRVWNPSPLRWPKQINLLLSTPRSSSSTPSPSRWLSSCLEEPLLEWGFVTHYDYL